MKIIITIDTDTNEVNVRKEQIEEVNKPDTSVYAKWFNDGCTGWIKNPEYNLMFLRMQERYANDFLKAKGHLFLNEVYDILGIPRTSAGAVVGWIYDENSVVDFGLTDKCNQDFVNGCSFDVLLNFNVQGNILDKI